MWQVTTSLTHGSVAETAKSNKRIKHKKQLLRRNGLLNTSSAIRKY